MSRSATGKPESLQRMIQSAADRVFNHIHGEQSVEVQYELTKSPGGLTTSQFVMRVGSCLSHDSLLTMNESLESAVLEMLGKCESRKTRRQRDIEFLREQAAKLGFSVVAPKGGAK